MPDEIEMYCARLDVLMARIDAMKKRVPASIYLARLMRMKSRCRLLKRRLFRLKRPDARLDEKLSLVLKQACGILKEAAVETDPRGQEQTSDANTIRVRVGREPSLFSKELQSPQRRNKMQKSN
jgi:hypothetical protein